MIPDMEKVIKGLKECAGNGNCTKCQYGKEKQALSCKKLLADALELIKSSRLIHSVEFALQGWQCPICKKVYSPSTQMCYYCGNGVPYTASSTTVGDAVIDWLHHESETKAEKPKGGR